MKTDVLLISYLKEKFGHTENVITYAKNNNLYYAIAYLLGIDIEKDFSYKVNVLRHKFYMNIFDEIFRIFFENSVEAIFFKGVVLANKLYDKPQKRYFGDIDIFVYRNDFPQAVTLLIKSGYEFCDADTFYNEHHIVLTKNNVKVELHKNIFNPQIGISEKYLLNNTESYQIMGHTITTFDITSSLLQLIYHLYMDTYFTYKEIYYAYADIINIIENKSDIKTGRFLYRAYEIALFIEKYNYEICWDDIQVDLKCQNLCILFKKTILDILEIFPNAFPETILTAILQLNYIADNEIDQLYKYTTKSEIMCDAMNLNDIMCNYVNENWAIHSEKKLHICIGNFFTITSDSVDEKNPYDFYCVVGTEKEPEGLKISFRVSYEEFYFSDINNYDTLASDGVHLLLCGTKVYSYNSIFFFPKIIHDELRVIPCDVRDGEGMVLEADMIKTEILLTNDEYIITAILSDRFIKKNHLEEYFYLGLVVSDCSRETKCRKRQLILAEDATKWCNPVYFAKVDM